MPKRAINNTLKKRRRKKSNEKKRQKRRQSKRQQRLKSLRQSIRQKRLNSLQSRKKNTNKLPVVYGHVYSDQCGHCVNMQNDWNNLCSQVKDIELRDIGVDYDENIKKFNNDFNTELSYEGFPTIFRLSNKGAKPDYYYGERTAPSMKKWLYS